MTEYGTVYYNAKEDITAVFQLVELGDQVVVQSHVWAQFLNMIERQLGVRFMRQTGLNELNFTEDDDDD